MSYDGRAVANFILDRCAAEGRPVSNLSLQKIVFFCHAWSLIELDRPLVKHAFEAWQFGPVLQYLYREFKSFDRSPITDRARRLNSETGEFEIVSYEFDSRTVELLDRIVRFYSQLRSSDLVDISHAPGGPWHKTWHHGGSINPGMKIDESDIRAFYSKVPSPFRLQ